MEKTVRIASLREVREAARERRRLTPSEGIATVERLRRARHAGDPDAEAGLARVCRVTRRSRVEAVEGLDPLGRDAD